MSGLAHLMLNEGYHVSGSDMNESENVLDLRKAGAHIEVGHRAENVTDADLVVYSSAVQEENVELAEARLRGIPAIKRAEMLAEAMRLYDGIAVSGTHGKTTTTSMLGSILIEAQHDPTVIVGGKLHAFGDTNIRVGNGTTMVVEADEYDRSFLRLNPAIVVITNIDNDHLDTYETIDQIVEAFKSFANKVPFYGFVTICLDDAQLQRLLPLINRKVVSYGINSQSDYQAKNITMTTDRTEFDVVHDGEVQGRIGIRMPGEHNVQNAIAATAVALELGADFGSIQTALNEYGGVFRRFELIEQVGETQFIDDYAHHPTEVMSTLKAAKAAMKKRVVCVFQPHTYSRTRDQYREFAQAFILADILIVLPVYPAREEPIQGIDGHLISETSRRYGHKASFAVQTKEEAVSKVIEVIKEGDVCITMGAGDVYKLMPDIISKYKEGVG